MKTIEQLEADRDYWLRQRDFAVSVADYDYADEAWRQICLHDAAIRILGGSVETEDVRPARRMHSESDKPPTENVGRPRMAVVAPSAGIKEDMSNYQAAMNRMAREDSESRERERVMYAEEYDRRVYGEKKISKRVDKRRKSE